MTISLGLPIWAARTPSAMVSELQISTAVLVRAQPDVHLLAAFDEGLIVGGAIHQVGAEQPAEEHDFGQQEHPHAEGGGFLLLLHVGEVVL